MVIETRSPKLKGRSVSPVPIDDHRTNGVALLKPELDSPETLKACLASGRTSRLASLIDNVL